MYDAFLRSAGIVRNVDRRIKLPTLRANNVQRFGRTLDKDSSRNFYVSIILSMEIAESRRKRSWAARKFETYANHMSRCQRSE